jgi:ferric-dicitrate binding protein FerR (iron transport regulator)
MERDALVAEIIELATACQTGGASDDERARLERLLEDNPDARTVYLRVADDTVTLNDVRRKEASGESAPVHAAAVGSARRAPWIALTLAASVALAAAAWWWTAHRAGEAASAAGGAPGPSFARIVSLSGVEWVEGAAEHREWQRLAAGETLAFDAGSVEVLFDNGAQLVVQGPAECQFVSEHQVRASSGKLVARVGPEATGFEIVTPHATVIDRGTSFGMTIEREHHSDVVVYEGMVDLSLPEAAANGRRRLGAGEAIRVGRDGQLGRIASVTGGQFLPPLTVPGADADDSRVIAAVTDNLKSSDTAKYYRVVARGFREDCPAYVDRRHQWNGVDERGIPPFLRGADYVMTFNDDKVQHDLRIAVSLSQPARLYLLVDDRADPPPKWLSEVFSDTGFDVAIDEGYDDVPEVQTAVGPGKSLEWTFSVWYCDVTEPTTVLLGSLQQEEIDSPPREVLRAMYGIVATPLGAEGPWTD